VEAGPPCLWPDVETHCYGSGNVRSALPETPSTWFVSSAYREPPDERAKLASGLDGWMMTPSDFVLLEGVDFRERVGPFTMSRAENRCLAEGGCPEIKEMSF
jgi:hypothetical protein